MPEPWDDALSTQKYAPGGFAPTQGWARRSSFGSFYRATSRLLYTAYLFRGRVRRLLA